MSEVIDQSQLIRSSQSTNYLYLYSRIRELISNSISRRRNSVVFSLAYKVESIYFKIKYSFQTLIKFIRRAYDQIDRDDFLGKITLK